MKKILIIALFAAVGCKGNLSQNNTPSEDDPQNQENNVTDNPMFDGEIPDIDACKEIAVDPGPFNARRMTDWEYVRTVRYTFDVDVAAEVADLFPKDARVNGFTNTGEGLITSIDHIIALEQLAQTVAAKVPDWPTFVGNHTSCTDETDACEREFIENVGFKAFRRPLTTVEVDRFTPLFEAARVEGDDYMVGSELVLRAMLQSPQFLFRLEQQTADDAEIQNVTAYEMASRLSYLIWATSPDDALYNAAASDALKTDAEISEQVDRMLADPRAKEASVRYVRDWLALDAADDLQRDEFPEYTPTLIASMKEETLTFFEKQIWEDETVLGELFTAQHTYANRELAEFYGFDNPQDGVNRYDLSSQPERIGFLTHAGILAVSGKASDPSLVERGLFVMNGVFCDSVQTQLDVVPELGPIEEGKSQRYYAEQRLDNAGCVGCHRQFDPLGAAMERFDGLGQYLTNDAYGNELREDGAFLNKATGEMVDFATIGEFVEKASQTEAARDCMIKKPVQFALGRSLLQSDACMLAGIKTDFDPAQTTYQQLMRSIATNPYFRVVRTASADPAN